MFFNLVKLFQKCILVALAVVLCLIVMENFLNKLIFNHSSERSELILRESSIVALEQPQAADTIVESSNNNINADVVMSSTDDSQMSEAAAILLWWTPFIGEMEYTKNCGNSVCFFTGNHKYINHEKFKVVCKVKIFVLHLTCNCVPRR